MSISDGGHVLDANIVHGFGVLAFGPKTPLFEIVYGWATPLRRFWWPSRHLIIWTVGFAIMASIGTDVILERVSQKMRGLLSVTMALLIPLSFWIQGDRPFHANHTPIEYPVKSLLTNCRFGRRCDRYASYQS